MSKITLTHLFTLTLSSTLSSTLALTLACLSLTLACSTQLFAATLIKKHIEFSNIASHSKEMSLQDCKNAFTDTDLTLKDSNEQDELKISPTHTLEQLTILNQGGEKADKNGMIKRRWAGLSVLDTSTGKKEADFTADGTFSKADTKCVITGHIKLNDVTEEKALWCTANFKSTLR